MFHISPSNHQNIFTHTHEKDEFEFFLTWWSNMNKVFFYFLYFAFP